MTMREITVGCAKDCDIYLDPQCVYASRYHATIYYDGSQMMFKDTSTNGTMINNIRVSKRAVPIRHGDIIMLAGKYQLNWNQIDRFFPVAPPSPRPEPQPEPKPMVQSETLKWSWGAFSIYPIWGFFNGCWWAFFASFVGWSLIPSILFGVYGRRLAWENRNWSSAEDFNSTQNSWDTWGLILFIINIVVILMLFFAIIAAAA